MTPFSKDLALLMLEKNVRQKDLALSMGLSETHMSHILNGRRGPPSPEKLNEIINFLALDDVQKHTLITAAENSRRTITIPDDARPEGYVVAHELCANLAEMAPGFLAAIREIIRCSESTGRLGQNNPREVRSTVRG